MVATSYTLENKIVSLLRYVAWLWLLPKKKVEWHFPPRLNLEAILVYFENLRLETCADRLS